MGMARIAGQGSKWIRKTTRLAIYLRDGLTCAYCGRDLKEAAPCEIGLDHLVCSSHGGDNGPGNLITVCRECNSARGTRPWREYATGGAVTRILRLIAQPLNRTLARALIVGSGRWADGEEEA